MDELDKGALAAAGTVRARQDAPDFISSEHYEREAAEIVTAYLTATALPADRAGLVRRLRALDEHLSHQPLTYADSQDRATIREAASALAAIEPGEPVAGGLYGEYTPVTVGAGTAAPVRPEVRALPVPASLSMVDAVISAAYNTDEEAQAVYDALEAGLVSPEPVSPDGWRTEQ